MKEENLIIRDQEYYDRCIMEDNDPNTKWYKDWMKLLEDK